MDSPPIYKVLEVLYATLLPKNSHPFAYLRYVYQEIWFLFTSSSTLSIFICPENIDVNVHPTKHEVHFLHEELIVDCIQKAVKSSLLTCSSSRAYYTQSLLPTTEDWKTKTLQRPSAVDKVCDYNLVRTDSKEKKLEAFISPNMWHSNPKQKLRKQINLTSVQSLQHEVTGNNNEG